MRLRHAVTSLALRSVDHGAFARASWKNGLKNKGTRKHDHTVT